MSQEKMTGLAFDASQVAPASISDPIPPGWYNSEITDCEVLPVKGRNGGTRVKFEYTVIDGEYKGRKFFGSINNKNANPQAQEIGQRELSAICHAVQVIQVSDTKQFIGKTLQVKVKVKPEDKEGGYDAANEPKAYKPMDGGAATAPGFAAAPPFAQGPPANVVPMAPAPVAAFPPAGWLPHPQAPGCFYSGQEVLTEADLRARFAPVAAPVAPPVAMPPPVAPAPPMPPAAPVADFPPVGWMPHPQSPGFFYTATGQVMSEADLRATVAVPAAPVAPAVPVAPPVPAAPIPAAVPPAPGIPAAPAGGVPTPPWAQQ